MKKQILKEYELIMFKRTIGSIKSEDFHNEKNRIQTEMIRLKIPFNERQQAKNIGIEKAKKEL